MQASNVPGKIQKPFADNGDKQSIPVASQIGITEGRASYTDGFPPLTRTPIVAGGIPPFGTDMNGILNAITAIQRWQSAGGSFAYDGTFSAAIGGYPRGAVLARAAFDGFWISTADNNTANPDTGGAGWSAAFPAGVVGQSRNAKMSVTAASATATFTADEIIVSTALGGQNYRLSNFSKTINLATNGAGGMDTGTVPAAGYVAIYVIYNPATGDSALLAVNATSAIAPEVYGGANMPSGYTASALVSVWRTGSSQFVVGFQIGRRFSAAGIVAATSSVTIGSYTAVDVSSVVPRNAKFIWGDAGISGNNPDSLAITLASNNLGFDSRQVAISSSSGGNIYNNSSFPALALITPQTVYWRITINTGSLATARFTISQYEF